MEISVDKLKEEKNKVITMNKEKVKADKDKIKNEKKDKKRIEVKYNKRPQKQINTEFKKQIIEDDIVLTNEHTPNEWLTSFIEMFYEVISLPAGQDKEEFKKKLLTSRDMRELLEYLPINFILLNFPKEALYLLSYMSHYLQVKKVKFLGQNKNIEVLKNNIDGFEVKE